MYHITPEGKEVLAVWVEYMEKQMKNLKSFVELYRRHEIDQRP
jgi:DNA-binding PadR family transcriptional regulator